MRHPTKDLRRVLDHGTIETKRRSEPWEPLGVGVDSVLAQVAQVVLDWDTVSHIELNSNISRCFNMNIAMVLHHLFFGKGGPTVHVQWNMLRFLAVQGHQNARMVPQAFHTGYQCRISSCPKLLGYSLCGPHLNHDSAWKSCLKLVGTKTLRNQTTQKVAWQFLSLLIIRIQVPKPSPAQPHAHPI